MSVNKFKPHVLVIPEDDANRQIANGFVLHFAVPSRAIQVLVEAGGWLAVRNRLVKDEIGDLERLPDRFLILLVDFDEHDDRIAAIMGEIPADLRERVFVIGVWSEPERLKTSVGRSYEEIGTLMAADCFEESRFIWGHPLLRHNAPELARLSDIVRPILFPAA